MAARRTSAPATPPAPGTGAEAKPGSGAKKIGGIDRKWVIIGGVALAAAALFLIVRARSKTEEESKPEPVGSPEGAGEGGGVGLGGQLASAAYNEGLTAGAAAATEGAAAGGAAASGASGAIPVEAAPLTSAQASEAQSPSPRETPGAKAKPKKPAGGGKPQGPLGILPGGIKAKSGHVYPNTAFNRQQRAEGGHHYRTLAQEQHKPGPARTDVQHAQLGPPPDTRRDLAGPPPRHAGGTATPAGLGVEAGGIRGSDGHVYPNTAWNRSHPHHMRTLAQERRR